MRAATFRSGAAGAAMLALALCMPPAWAAGSIASGVSEEAVWLRFEQQSTPALETVMLRREVTPGYALSNIVLRVVAETLPPSALRLCLHVAGNDRVWVLGLPCTADGESRTFEVSIAAEAGWSWGPNSTPEQFARDILDIDWIGVEVVRNGSGAAQSYAVKDFTAATYELDLDGDGIPDPWELAHGLSTSDARESELDSDGDGLSNREEYLADTNPRNALSALRIIAIQAADNAVRLKWSGGQAAVQYVEKRELNSPSWSNLTVLTPPTALTNSITDTSGQAAFYRVRAQRP